MITIYIIIYTHTKLLFIHLSENISVTPPPPNEFWIVCRFLHNANLTLVHLGVIFLPKCF